MIFFSSFFLKLAQTLKGEDLWVVLLSCELQTAESCRSKQEPKQDLMLTDSRLISSHTANGAVGSGEVKREREAEGEGWMGG